MSDGLGLALATTLPTVFNAVEVPWSPAQITTQLWLDAADAATITEVGGDISQWDDKSGNLRHAVQAVALNQPSYNTPGLNGLNTIELGGNEWFDVDLDFLAGVNHTAFIVTRTDSYANIYGAANPGQGSQSLHIGFQNAGNYRINYWGNDYYPSITANFNVGSFNYLRYTWDDAGNTKLMHANGSLEGQNGSAGTISAMNGGGRLFNVVNQGIYDGAIAEMVFLTGTVTAETITLMEEYLTNKWGI